MVPATGEGDGLVVGTLWCREQRVRQAAVTDDETGFKVEISAGDFVVLPPGWSGRWDVTETVRKTYTIF